MMHKTTTQTNATAKMIKAIPQPVRDAPEEDAVDAFGSGVD